MIPVIADISPDAVACDQGELVAGAWYMFPFVRTLDPMVNPSHEHIIVGFVRSLIYDVDIGAPPLPEVACSSEDRPQPWTFTVNGAPTSCNLVRARLSCDTRFIPATDNPDPSAERARFIRY